LELLLRRICNEFRFTSASQCEGEETPQRHIPQWKQRNIALAPKSRQLLRLVRETGNLTKSTSSEKAMSKARNKYKKKFAVASVSMPQPTNVFVGPEALRQRYTIEIP
jgi:hypothetical protein